VKAFFSRAILIIIAFPLFYLFIFRLPWLNHLILNICSIGAALLGTLEVIGLFKKRSCSTFNIIAITAGVSLPVVAYLQVLFSIDASILIIWLNVLLIAIFMRAAFINRKKTLSCALDSSAATVMAAVYPGFFIAYVVKISGLNNASLLFLYFFSVVFANDILAYLMGLSIGKTTRLGLLISPKKSLIGFIFGFLGSVGVSILFYYIFPDLFPVGIIGVILLGSLFGIIGILGDLAESSLKRSAEVKDSGEIIPGRGGLLDSIDSMLFVAPVFYYFFEITQKYLS